MIVPSSVRTSTHAVFPPYLAVRSPGTGMDPRVPQKRTNKAPPPFEGVLRWVPELEKESHRIATPNSESIEKSAGGIRPSCPRFWRERQGEEKLCYDREIHDFSADVLKKTMAD